MNQYDGSGYQNTYGGAGGFSGNQFLVPLVGGSGGAGYAGSRRCGRRGPSDSKFCVDNCHRDRNSAGGSGVLHRAGAQEAEFGSVAPNFGGNGTITAAGGRRWVN